MKTDGKLRNRHDPHIEKGSLFIIHINGTMLLFGRSVVSDSLVTPGTVVHQDSLSIRDFPGKNTRVGCHFLLQGIFPTQGSSMSPASTGGFFTTEPPSDP